MKAVRRLLGTLVFVFMALPTMFGGLTLLSVRGWATDPAAYKALVADARFTALLESPDLARHVEDDIELGGLSLEGPAAVSAIQAAVPASAFVKTAENAIDAVFETITGGGDALSIDLKPFKDAVAAGAGTFADTYLDKAEDPLAALPAGLLPPGAAEAAATPQGAELTRTAFAGAVTGFAAGIPDAYVADTAEMELPADLTPAKLSEGIAAAGIWLTIASAALLVAAASMAESDWRKRLGRIGTGIMIPGAVILCVGLLPRLVNPAGMVPVPGVERVSEFTALAEYLRFVAGRLSGGFLTVGLVAVGTATALLSAKRAIPPAEDDEDIA